MLLVGVAAGARAADRSTLGEFIPVAPPQPAPAVSFTTEAGKPASLGDFKGKPAVVNLWATWCGPCRREMPSLDKLQAAFAGRLTVAAIAEDHGGATVVDPFVAKQGFRALTVFLDPKEAVAQAFGVSGLPTSLVLDAKGRVVGKVVGAADWTSAKMLAVLRPLIEGGGMPALIRAAR
jgi:thiol-disulfide isomerase/thioredoxin